MHGKMKLIVILGPTASGKSDLAVGIARRFNGEIVSADSRQVYRKLNIGTGKITKREMKGVRHHLLDIASPTYQFSVTQYEKLATCAILNILKRGKIPILCGGAGFYIQCIVDNIIIPEVPPNVMLRKKLEKKDAAKLFAQLQKLDPRRAATIDIKNPARLVRAIEIADAIGAVPRLTKNPPPYDILQIGIAFSRTILNQKIEARLTARFKRGMITEARRLHAQGLSWKRMRELGLEYRALADFLTGKTTRAEMKTSLAREIYQYAKRQMTWFKRDKRIVWIGPSEQKRALEMVRRFVS
jgi:tRNA dimethylallyltransferase